MQAQRPACLKAQKNENACAVWGMVSKCMTGLAGDETEGW